MLCDAIERSIGRYGRSVGRSVGRSTVEKWGRVEEPLFEVESHRPFFHFEGKCFFSLSFLLFCGYKIRTTFGRMDGGYEGEEERREGERERHMVLVYCTKFKREGKTRQATSGRPLPLSLSLSFLFLFSFSKIKM